MKIFQAGGEHSLSDITGTNNPHCWNVGVRACVIMEIMIESEHNVRVIIRVCLCVTRRIRM